MYPFTPYVPTVDGRISDEELDNSINDIAVPSAGGQWVAALIGGFHDTQRAYIYVDAFGDLTNDDADSTVICFDSFDDGGDSWNSNDKCFGLEASFQGSGFRDFIAQGTGQGNFQLIDDIAGTGVTWGVGFGTDRFEPQPHRIYELSVPISYLQENTEKYGFAVYYYDASSSQRYYYPVENHGVQLASCFPKSGTFTPYCSMAPKYWGNLVAPSPQTIPEFPAGIAILTASLMTTIIILRSKIRRISRLRID